MKEALIAPGPKVQIVDSPIPEPNDDQVRIKVVVSGSNPKDWKVPEWQNTVINQGDDIAGVVDKVGANVTEFKPGDRVAAFHEMMSPHGSYAEYAIAWAHTTFHIPKTTSFEEASTIPLAAMTSAIALYNHLGLPEPWRPADPGADPTPLIIYGAGSAVGAFAIQLARRSGIHPLICVAGRSSAHIETLIDRSRGDIIVDYRGDTDADSGKGVVVKRLREALGGRTSLHALDAVSDAGSHANLVAVLGKGARVARVLAPRAGDDASGVEVSQTFVGSVHKDTKDFGFVSFRLFGRGLAEGWFAGHPTEVVPGGLGGVQTALDNLKAGKASAVKYVFRIADTEGVAGK